MKHLESCLNGPNRVELKGPYWIWENHYLVSYWIFKNHKWILDKKIRTTDKQYAFKEYVELRSRLSI